MHDRLNAKAAITAGIVAGIVFMLLEMALVMLVQGQSPWGPPRMMGAIVMGKDVLPPPASFDATIMAVGTMVHMVLSIVLAFILGWIISHWRMSLMTAIIAGIVFGLIVYLVDFYIMTAMFPWFAMARGPINIFAHAVFGLVAGWVYHAMARPDHVDDRREPA